VANREVPVAAEAPAEKKVEKVAEVKQGIKRKGS